MTFKRRGKAYRERKNLKARGHGIESGKEELTR